MNKATALRWIVLGSALAGTVAAILYPIDSPEPTLVRTLTVRPATAPGSAEAPDVRRVEWVATDSDPFAPRGWVASPVPMAAPLVVATVDVAAVPPPPPPPLPYKFVGQMRDGSDTVVYLGSGDQVVLARSGETLDGGYKVVAITANQIEFESTALGIRQTLPIPVQD